MHISSLLIIIMIIMLTCLHINRKPPSVLGVNSQTPISKRLMFSISYKFIGNEYIDNVMYFYF